MSKKEESDFQNLLFSFETFVLRGLDNSLMAPKTAKNPIHISIISLTSVKAIYT